MRINLKDYFKQGDIVKISKPEPRIAKDGCIRMMYVDRDYLVDEVYPFILKLLVTEKFPVYEGVGDLDILKLWDTEKFPVYVGIGDLVISGYFQPEDFTKGNEKSLEFKKLYGRGIGGPRNNKKQFV